MSRRLAALAFVSLVSLSACASAQTATRTYSVTAFSKIRMSGPFDVQVRVGGAPGARAVGAQEAIDRLSVEQNGDTLVLKPLPGGWGGWAFGNHGKLTVEVSMPALSQVAMTGSGDMNVDRARGDALDLMLSGSGNLAVAAVEVGRLSATLTGSGDLSVAGHAGKAFATLTGSGDLKGEGLRSDDAEAKLIGSGDLTVGAEHTAKVTLGGSGDIRIAGPANCLITKTGSGDVVCAHQSAH